MVATLDSMSRQKKKPEQQSDRHRPRKMTAIRQHFVEPAQVLMARLGITDLTELVNMALREKLEREKLWPFESATE